jgi:hypothetical protein
MQWMDHSLVNHSLIERQLSSFQCLTHVSKASTNSYIQVLIWKLWACVLTLEWMPKGTIAGLYSNCMFYLKYCETVFQSGHNIFQPHSNVCIIQLFCILARFGCHYFLKTFSHSSARCTMIPDPGFNVHLPVTLKLTFVHVFTWLCMSSWFTCLFGSIAHFLIVLLIFLCRVLRVF